MFITLYVYIYTLRGSLTFRVASQDMSNCELYYLKNIADDRVVFRLITSGVFRTEAHPHQERPLISLTIAEDDAVFYRSKHSEHAQKRGALNTETPLVIGQHSCQSFKHAP